MALGGLLPTIKKIKANRTFTIDELYEILNEKSNIKGLYIQGKGLNRCLYAPGVDKYDVSIAPGKKNILLTEYVRKGEGLKDFAAASLTGGISDIIGRNKGAGIDKVIDEYKEEIERVLSTIE